MPGKSSQLPSVQVWLDLLAGAWKSQALIAAVDLDLFSCIAKGNKTAERIAAAANTSERGVRRLLDALVGIGYLKRSRQHYQLTPASADFLVRDQPLYAGDGAFVGKMLIGAWSMLAEVVKSGRPFTSRNPDEQAQFFARLVPALFPANFTSAQIAVKRLPAAARRRIKQILDVGAGSAAWSIAFARALKQTRVTVVDFPVVAEVARQYAQRWGVGDRFDYIEGDFHQLEFEAGRFDLAILGHIVHGVGAEGGARLLKRMNDALAPGGMLLIAEFIPNDERTGPPVPLLFSLNMLINTESGDVFTLREYRAWLKQAGFSKVTTIPLPNFSPLILATK